MKPGEVSDVVHVGQEFTILRLNAHTPAGEIREAMGIRVGDSVEMRFQDYELRVSTRRARIRRAQERIRQLIPPGVSLSEELSAERREAAKHE
jgi:bifunctional DNA-binding transcriptional regulator/antitoxin component of YhaV-PrlF toxin-antitoxin module